jgi:hypothetical protein
MRPSDYVIFYATAAGGQSFTPAFILRQDFNTLSSAPLSTPQAGEVGSLTVVQNDGNLAITENGLVINTPQATPAYGDLGVFMAGGVTRAPGLALSFLFKLPTSAQLDFTQVGFTSVASVAYNNVGGSFARSAFGREVFSGGLLSRAGLAYPFGVDNVLLTVILRASGAFFIQDQRLIAVHYSETTATLYPFISYQAASQPQVRFMRLAPLPAAASDDALLVYRDATPTNGDVIETGQDALIYVDWKPTAADVLDIQFRRIDDNNTMIARFSQAGTVKIIMKKSGVETEQQSSSFTFNSGTTYRVAVRYEDNRPVVFGVNLGFRLESTQAYNSHVTGAKIVGTTANISNLDVWKVDLDGDLLEQFNVFTNPVLP